MPYELKSLALPTLRGWTLRSVAELLDTAVGERTALPGLLKQGGLDQVARWRLTEPPTFLPSHPVPPVLSEKRALEPTLPSVPFCTAARLAVAYREGEVDPVAIADRVITAIRDAERADPPLCAFIDWRTDDIERQARESASRFLVGTPRGPLDGIPIAIKDEIDVATYPTTAGTKILTSPKDTDAVLVERLRNAGRC